MEEPTYNLAISFIKGEATEETRQQWNKTRMNKASLFAYEQKKEPLQQMEGKTLKQKVPVELHAYLSVFSDEEANQMPKRTEYDHKIEIKHGFIMKRSKVYCIDLVNDKAFNEFINENLKKGYIRKPEQDAPQAAGFFFVPKKDGKVRPVQDYRYLNKWTVKNAYPLPRIDELMDSLNRKTLFTKMDVCWGYNNVRIRKGAEWKAAFVSKRGIFEPTVMFFGLMNSPATFQSMMDTIFAIEIAQGWLKIFMDDLLIANEGDRKDMVEKIRIVLEKLKANCYDYATIVDTTRHMSLSRSHVTASYDLHGVLWPL